MLLAVFTPWWLKLPIPALELLPGASMGNVADVPAGNGRWLFSRRRGQKPTSARDSIGGGAAAVVDELKQSDGAVG